MQPSAYDPPFQRWGQRGGVSSTLPSSIVCSGQYCSGCWPFDAGVRVPMNILQPVECEANDLSKFLDHFAGEGRVNWVLPTEVPLCRVMMISTYSIPLESFT